MRMSEILHQNWALRRMAIPTEGFETLIGVSPAFQNLLRLVKDVAPVRSTALIVGETGTGKELLARAIHNLSPDHDQPYQLVDCTRFPEGMIESELFGHVKGAFTGAVADKMGLLELADGGSVFLDEIADLPLSLQAKLLRVLEEGEVRPVGGTRSKKIDVRFIAATNQDLEARVSRGDFRKDLFYRLNVVTLRVPPLRDRVEDIPLLARHFLIRFAREFGKAVTELHPSAVTDLVVYTWPGNIRELRNVIERAVMLCTGDRLTSKELALLLPSVAEGSAAADSLAGEEYLCFPYSEAKEKVLETFTLRYIKGKLAAHGGNVTRAAQDSGVPRQHFQQIMKRYFKNDA
jgi:transcriptional regulator with PAS, ATPase and Fis domain